MNPRIIIIHPEGNVCNNPSLAGIVEILCEQGYTVDVYSRKRPHLIQELNVQRARFFTTDIQDAADTAVLFQPEAVFSWDVLAGVKQAFSGCSMVIGIDRGIIEAARLAEICQVPYGLISYEIYFADETGPEFKLPEKLACQKLAFAVCQDRLRSSHLSIENSIPMELIIDIPVAGRSVEQSGRNFLLHDALGINRSRKIALYIGEVSARWSGFAELLESTYSWDDSWVLVLHHRYGEVSEEIRVRLDNHPNVFISPFPPLSLHELPKLINSADLGIALYIPQMDSPIFQERNNLLHIGMASGKIATYLQHGLPILVNEIGEMSEHVRQYGLGCVVGDIKHTGAVLSRLSRPLLDLFRDSILMYYRDLLSLDVTIKPLLEILGRVLAGKGQERLSGVRSSAVNTGKPGCISIVTPSFNQARYLEECIDSVLSQNYPNLEYIVMDGGSSDGSVEIIRKYEKYLKYWQSRPDNGQYAAIDAGLRMSTGPIMTWLNSDDKLHPGALETIAEVFSEYGDVSWVMGRPNGLDAYGNQSWVLDFLPLWSREKYLGYDYHSPFIQQEGTFWRRELWDKAGGYIRHDLKYAGDLELWARFFRYAQLYSLDALIAGYRQHPQQKMAGFLDMYHQEAKAVLDFERELFQYAQNRRLLPAPLPIIPKQRDSHVP